MTGVLYETVRAPEKYVKAYNELMALPTNRLRIRTVGDTLRRIDEPVVTVPQLEVMPDVTASLTAPKGGE